MATGSDFAALTIDGREIRISRPGKVFFPDVPVSKMQLVEYYVSVGEGALRGVYRRPTVLKRFPDGINGEVFFQKRVPTSAARLAPHGDCPFSLGAFRRRALPPGRGAHYLGG